MFPKHDKFEMLMKEPQDIIREMFPDGDLGSPIPIEYQNIGPYTLNEKGVHAIEFDKSMNMEVIPIYPIPFICHMKENGNIIFDFFLPELKTLEVESTLEKFLDEYFHSLPGPQKLHVKRYCSYCIMKLWEIRK